jgi:hypothetical protein
MLQRDASLGAEGARLERNLRRRQSLGLCQFRKGQRLHGFGVNACGSCDSLGCSGFEFEVQRDGMPGVDFDMRKKLTDFAVVGGRQACQPAGQQFRQEGAPRSLATGAVSRSGPFKPSLNGGVA